MNQKGTEGKFEYIIFCSPTKDFKIFKEEAKNNKIYTCPSSRSLGRNVGYARSDPTLCWTEREREIPTGNVVNCHNRCHPLPSWTERAWKNLREKKMQVQMMNPEDSKCRKEMNQTNWPLGCCCGVKGSSLRIPRLRRPDQTSLTERSLLSPRSERLWLFPLSSIR